MGRKRTAEERRRCSEENGLNDDDTDVDDDPIPRDVLDYTKGRYDVQMELWLEYVSFPAVRSRLELTFSKVQNNTPRSHSSQFENPETFRRVHDQVHQRIARSKREADCSNRTELLSMLRPRLEYRQSQVLGFERSHRFHHQCRFPEPPESSHL